MQVLLFLFSLPRTFSVARFTSRVWTFPFETLVSAPKACRTQIEMIK